MGAGRSIKHYLLTSWLLSLLVAVAGSAALSFGIAYLDYSNHRQVFESKLRDDAKVVARRVAAELLLGPNGRLEAIQQQLLSDFSLTSLEIYPAEGTRAQPSGKESWTEIEVPGLSPPAMMRVSAGGPNLSEHINLRSFLLALVPILTLVLSGFLIQRYLLSRYLIRPIQALAGTTVGNRPVHNHWPVEIRKLAEELAESFSRREQAIFGQLARGLIHDIRTLINSMNTALQLVEETEPGSDDYQRRIEKLKSACSRNIPKLKELLELSLDSSREVVVKRTSPNVLSTLQQSIQNIRDIADAKGVELVTQDIGDLAFAHDRVQLERVFTNLLKNAVEALEDTPSDRRRVEITGTLSKNELSLEIEDTGPGFADPRAAFRPLKTTKSRGYGLGLFVSRKIVEAHQGSLQAGRSQRLGGAKMTLSFSKEETRV